MTRPTPSPITTLGHVRIEYVNLDRACSAAALSGLLIDCIYGNKDKRLIDVSCRHMGPRGNHEPRWTDAERDEFARAGL